MDPDDMIPVGAPDPPTAGAVPQVRILHIIGSVDPASGGPIEGVIRQHLAQVKAQMGHREVVSLDSPAAPFLKDFPLVAHPMGPRKYKPPGRNRLKRFGYTLKLVPWLRTHAHNYDVIVVNGLWNYSSVAAARVLPRLGVPYFVFTHGMLDPWFKKTYPVKHIQKQIFWTFFEGRLLKHAKGVLFTTEEEKQLADGAFWGQRYKPIVAGYGTARPPPATPEHHGAFRKLHPDSAERPYLLFMSRIHRKKGIDLLIEAFARVAPAFPEWDLVIAGPDRDNLVPAFKKQSRHLGIESRIHWVGMLTGAAKWGALYGAKAYILPSHQENFGISVAEAAGCGVPVLISDKINIWREIEAGGAGFVEPDTLEGTERLLRRAMALTPEALAHIGQAGLRVFDTHFDVVVSASKLYRLFSESLGRT